MREKELPGCARPRPKPLRQRGPRVCQVRYRVDPSIRSLRRPLSLRQGGAQMQHLLGCSYKTRKTAVGPYLGQYNPAASYISKREKKGRGLGGANVSVANY